MSTPVYTPTFHGFHELLGELYKARAAVAAERSSPTLDKSQIAAAQDRLLRALENYVSALSASGCPVPHRIRAELNLYRSLKGVS